MKKIFTLVAVAAMAFTASAQDNIFKATGENLKADAVLVDNEALTVKGVFASTGKKQDVTILGEKFTGYFQLRVETDPTADELTGTERAGSTPLVVTVKKALTLTFYDRRQKGNDGFDAGDNKALLVMNQADAKNVAGTNELDEATYEYPKDDTNKENPNYVCSADSFKLEPGTYTVYRKGSTMSIYGFKWTVEGAGEGEGDGAGVDAVDAANDDAPIYNMMGVRVDADAKGILIRNGKKFIRK